MSAEELTPAVPLVDGNIDLIRYHAKTMIEAGALEVADATQAQAEDGRPTELAFYFALPK